MSIQDDAFDIQRKLDRYGDTDHIHAAWDHFRTWAYALEEENDQLRFAFNAYKTVIKVHHLCICGNKLPKGNNTFCAKCSKLPRDNHGFPIRKR